MPHSKSEESANSAPGPLRWMEAARRFAASAILLWSGLISSSKRQAGLRIASRTFEILFETLMLPQSGSAPPWRLRPPRDEVGAA